MAPAQLHAVEDGPADGPVLVLGPSLGTDTGLFDAQAAGYFSPHDDHPEMRTLERAKQDAETLFTTKQNRVNTQQEQQRPQTSKGPRAGARPGAAKGRSRG